MNVSSGQENAGGALRYDGCRDTHSLRGHPLVNEDSDGFRSGLCG